MAALLADVPDSDLFTRAAALRGRQATGESADALLPEAFALVSATSGRISGRRCTLAELRAGVALFRGAVVELADRTAWPAAVTLAVFLGALEGRGVHLMTGDGAPVTATVCGRLGLTVARLSSDMEPDEKRLAYAADVTVGRIEMFGYDHLTDNLVSGPDERLQREPCRAIVAEADLVMLDQSINDLIVNRDGVRTASISVRACLARYASLAGITATVLTEAAEFAHLYGLSVETVDTAYPTARRDHPDLLYGTTEAKLNGLLEAIAGHHAAARPVLVITDSTEITERLADLLAGRGLPAARPHEERPLALAGRPATVTLLTQPAVEGEVALGGDLEWLAHEHVRASGLDPAVTSGDVWDEAVAAARRELLPTWTADRDRVIEAGGLVVLGAEYPGTRRLEARLRATAGARGDTQLFVALDEGWLRHPYAEWLRRLVLGRITEPLQGPLLARAVERAKRQCEVRIRGYRGRMAAYDTIVSAIRERMHAERRAMVEAAEPLGAVLAFTGGEHVPPGKVGTRALRLIAQEVIDEQWTACLAELTTMRDDYASEEHTREAVPAFREKAEAAYSTMRERAAQALTHRLRGTGGHWYLPSGDPPPWKAWR
ncbi:hypothetical protein BKM31_15540 [[Actinomadura] parvosata subsp. kistnae]|uniref:SecA family profile domain-containing protein n=2 Tax=Nonomuraea TaxID=83681 RepID=A0A1U9ZXK6_9ACTN|nr:hypothetical protein BKM31_15540 [Nonomuraea sp. ATCC 55076]